MSREIFDWEQIGEKAAHILAELLRIDTTNPPGNESAACRFLQPFYEELGLEVELVEAAPGRGSIIGRKRVADPTGPALLLMSHLDVVPAEAAGWSMPPFAGVIRDGHVWGRGAVDCKNAAVAEWFALKLILDSGHKLRRDVVLAALADEEAGGAYGAGWLCEHRPELLAAGFCINEGGGFGFSAAGREIYFCQTAEKGVCWLKLTAEGEPGHASLPRPDSALDRMLAALMALKSRAAPVRIAATVRQLVEEVIAGLGAQKPERPLNDEEIAGLLTRLVQAAELRHLLTALTTNTLAITMIQAGTKVNVIPGRVEAAVDCRLVPGEKPEELVREVEETVGKFGVKVEPLQLNAGTEIPARGELYEVLSRALARIRPGAHLVPFMVPGGTDGRFLAARGVQVFGFIPMQAEAGGDISVLRRAHGVNERIAIADLVFAVQVLYEVLRDFCTVPG